jgi:hypothetical protein
MAEGSTALRGLHHSSGRWAIALAFILCPLVRSLSEDSLQHLKEERHFVLSTSRQYEEQMWISYTGVFFYRPNDWEAEKILSAIDQVRSRYVAFTNKAEQNSLRLRILSESGIHEEYLKQFQAGFTEWDGKKREICVTGFLLIQSMENGDALIQTQDQKRDTYYVYDLGRAVDDKTYLIYEELKTFPTALGSSRTVRAYTRVNLRKADKEALRLIRFACSRHGLHLEAQIEGVRKRAADAKKK